MPGCLTRESCLGCRPSFFLFVSRTRLQGCLAHPSFMTVFGANNLISARHCGRYGKSGRWLGWLRGSGCPVYRVPQLSGSTVVHFPNSSGETFTQLHFYFHVCTALSRSRVCTPRCRPTPLSFTWCVLATVTLLGTLSVNLASVTP